MIGDTVKGTVYALLIAVVLNSVIYAIGRSLGVSFLVGQAGSGGWQEVPLGTVVVVSLIATLLAGAGVGIIGRFSDKALTSVMWLTAGLTLISLLIPLTQARDTASFAALGLMHVVVGLALLYGLVNLPWRQDDCGA